MAHPSPSVFFLFHKYVRSRGVLSSWHHTVASFTVATNINVVLTCLVFFLVGFFVPTRQQTPRMYSVGFGISENFKRSYSQCVCDTDTDTVSWSCDFVYLNVQVTRRPFLRARIQECAYSTHFLDYIFC